VSRSCAFWDVGYIQNTQERFVFQGFLRDAPPAAGCSPVTSEYIDKPKGGKRPLGMPDWSPKVIQEIIRSILEAYYEPQFSGHSHGFRPNRGCHTALDKIHKTWAGTKWFIEGDIKGCFEPAS